MKQHIIFLLSLSFLINPFAYAENKGLGEKKVGNFGYVTPKDATASPTADAARLGKLMMRVMVLGAATQGIHYLPEESDLLTCLLYVGGFGEDADLDDISIRRKGVKDLIKVDLEGLIEDGATIPPLKDGDIVTIPWNWKKDLELYYTITGFITSLTALTLSIVAVSD